LDLSFIILSWNSQRYLQRCFDSLIEKCRAEQILFEIIVIDNGSSDDSVTLLKQYQNRLPGQFTLISLDSNRGTTGPRNIGLRQAKGRNICILDSDTECGEGSISAVLGLLHEREDVGIIAPRLLLEDGSVQHSVKKFPAFTAKLLKLPKVLFHIQVADADFYEDFPFAAERSVDSAISACWFFRRELLAEVGMLDENIFYAPEDLDFCLRVRQAGKTIRYFPELTLLHHTQQLSHRQPFSKLSWSHFCGLLYYFRKHGGWFSSPRFQNEP
jgi:GT2 family glycosyltransferase